MRRTWLLLSICWLTLQGCSPGEEDLDGFTLPPVPQKEIDRLRVRWSSGLQEEFGLAPGNRSLTIEEGTGQTVEDSYLQ